MISFQSLDRGNHLTQTVGIAAAEPLKKLCERVRNEWNKLMTKSAEREALLEKTEAYHRWIESTDEQMAALGERVQVRRARQIAIVDPYNYWQLVRECLCCV